MSDGRSSRTPPGRVDAGRYAELRMRCTVRYTRCSELPGWVTANPLAALVDDRADVGESGAALAGDAAGTMNAVTVTALVTMLSEARDSRENENRGRET